MNETELASVAFTSARAFFRSGSAHSSSNSSGSTEHSVSPSQSHPASSHSRQRALVSSIPAIAISKQSRQAQLTYPDIFFSLPPRPVFLGSLFLTFPSFRLFSLARFFFFVSAFPVFERRALASQSDRLACVFFLTWPVFALFRPSRFFFLGGFPGFLACSTWGAYFLSPGLACSTWGACLASWGACFRPPLPSLTLASDPPF